LVAGLFNDFLQAQSMLISSESVVWSVLQTYSKLFCTGFCFQFYTNYHFRRKYSYYAL